MAALLRSARFRSYALASAPCRIGAMDARRILPLSAWLWGEFSATFGRFFDGTSAANPFSCETGTVFEPGVAILLAGKNFLAGDSLGGLRAGEIGHKSGENREKLPDHVVGKSYYEIAEEADEMGVFSRRKHFWMGAVWGSRRFDLVVEIRRRNQ